MENFQPKQSPEAKKSPKIGSEALNEINDMCTTIIINWHAELKQKEGINMTESVLVNADIKLRSSIMQKLKEINAKQNQLYCYVFLTRIEEDIEQRGLHKKATELTKKYILEAKRGYRIPGAEEEVEKIRMAA